MTISVALKAVAVLATAVHFAWAQLAPVPTTNITICNWAGLRTGVIRDTVYIDGGSLWWQTATVDGEPDIANRGGVEGFMFTLNLSYPFDTTVFNKTTSLLQPLSKTGGTAANNIAPNYVDGAMFVNDGELQLYGGLHRLTDAFTPPSAQSVMTYEAYQYGPDRSTWARGFIQSTLPDKMNRYVSNGAEVSVPSENLGFYFGGLKGAKGSRTTEQTSDWYLADSLVKVDMTTMRSEQWTNTTLPDDVPPRAGAELVWIPVGGQGVLVAIGGITAVEHQLSAGLNKSQETAAKAEGPTFTESLPVFDVASESWYMQNTTGEGPGLLTEFCSVMAPAKDSSSFNIYIYGGYDGLSDESIPSDDVWILSIPSFTWIKAYSGSPSHGRRGHKCERVYPDQMFIIGGISLSTKICLKDGPIQVFNLNSLKFQDLYDPAEYEAYAVPAIVIDKIGGNKEGDATKTTEFSDDALATLFGTPYTKDQKVYYPYSPANSTSSATPPPIVKSEGGGLAKWVAPVLGVVLGLVVLSIIAAGFILISRRKKHSHAGSVTSSGTRGRGNNIIRNWVKHASTSNNTSGFKTDSVTSTDENGDPYMSSPIVGSHEVGGRPRYEIAAGEKEKDSAPVEMPTQWNFESHPNHSSSIDYAYGPGTSTKDSSTQPGDRSDGNSGLGINPIAAAISPQSPQNRHHYPTSTSGGRSNDANTSVGLSSEGGAPSPLSHAQSPNDTSISAHSSPNSPTLLGNANAARNPDLTSPGHSNTLTAGGATGLTHRPSHTRNISSLSSTMPQSPLSPVTAISPDDDDPGLRSRYVSGVSVDSVRPLGSLDSVTDEQKGLVSPDEETARTPTGFGKSGGAGGVERKKTAAKKSSFNEMLDRNDEPRKS